MRIWLELAIMHHRRKGDTVAAEENLAGTDKNSRLIKEDAKESQIRIWPELASLAVLG